MNDFLTLLPERIGWTIVHSLWQFSLIAAVLLLVLRVLRRSSPASRYLAECIALGLMAFVAITTFQLVDVKQMSGAPGAAALENRNANAPAELDARASSVAPAPHALPLIGTEPENTHASSYAIVPLERWRRTVSTTAALWLHEIAGGWLLGMLVLSIRPILGWLGVRKLRRRGVTNLELALIDSATRIASRVGVSRVVRVVESSMVEVPTVIGVLKPLILLPASSVTGLPREQLEAVLAHELAHVRRHDFLVNAIQVLLETVFFYHPAIWWVSHQMRTEREACCDEIAVNLTGDRPGYVELLLWLNERRREKPPTIAALSSSGGSLLDRARRILRPQGSASPGTGLLLLLTTLPVLVGPGLWLSADGQETQIDTKAPSESLNVVDTEASFAVVASQQFVHSVARQILLYMEPADVKAFAKELEGYLSERVTEDVAAENKLIAASAIEEWVRQLSPESHGYLSFRGKFDMLGWQLWTFAEREPLTPSEIEQREEQRNWIRRYVRNLPAPDSDVEDWQHAGRLALVESEVFSNPLSPFFYEPMDEDEFAEFKQRLKERQGQGSSRLIHAPAHIFAAGVFARVDQLRQQYPPGFPVGGLSIGGTQHFGFRADVFEQDARYWISDLTPASPNGFYDAERNIAVNLPRDLGESDKENWINEKGVDLHYDAQTGRILTVGGAKLAKLPETDWYKIDQLPTDELLRMAESDPIEAFAIGAVTLKQLYSVDEKLSQLPTGILLTPDGKLVLFRVEHQDLDSIYVFFRPRPLPPYPPFYNGVQAVEHNRPLKGSQSD